MPTKNLFFRAQVQGRKGVTTYGKYFLLKKIKFRLVTFTLISEKPNNDFKLNAMLAWEIVSMKSNRDQMSHYSGLWQKGSGFRPHSPQVNLTNFNKKYLSCDVRRKDKWIGNRKQEATPLESVSKRHNSWQVRCEHASQIRRNANEKSIF